MRWFCLQIHKIKKKKHLLEYNYFAFVSFTFNFKGGNMPKKLAVITEAHFNSELILLAIDKILLLQRNM